MNYSEQIFELLQIKPFEVFKLKDNYKKDFICWGEFCISPELILRIRSNKYNNWKIENTVSVIDILNGTYSIVKEKTILSNKEKITIEYFKNSGYKWIAKDKNGKVYAYKEKPIKYTFWGFWAIHTPMSKDTVPEVEYPLSFIDWSDTEPYYIGE